MVGDVDVSLLAGRASARAACVPLSLDLPPPSDCLVWLPRGLQRGAPLLEHAASGATGASCSVGPDRGGSPLSAPRGPWRPHRHGAWPSCGCFPPTSRVPWGAEGKGDPTKNQTTQGGLAGARDLGGWEGRVPASVERAQQLCGGLGEGPGMFETLGLLSGG